MFSSFLNSCDDNCTQNSNSSQLLTDAELGFSSIPLSTGQTGSHTAIKLTTTVVQGINLNEMRKCGDFFVHECQKKMK